MVFSIVCFALFSLVCEGYFYTVVFGFIEISWGLTVIVFLL